MCSPPTGINAIRSDRIVEIRWGPDHIGRYSNKLLRTSCACAQCVDEMTGRRILDPDTVQEDIEITDMQLVGNYAVKFSFSDGHNTGIATWAHLRGICPCPKCG